MKKKCYKKEETWPHSKLICIYIDPVVLLLIRWHRRNMCFLLIITCNILSMFLFWMLFYIFDISLKLSVLLVNLFNQKSIRYLGLLWKHCARNNTRCQILSWKKLLIQTIIVLINNKISIDKRNNQTIMSFELLSQQVGN